jgi:D-alanyl-D-alanine endopeptidase (penicillin-binding protein 7)
MVRSSCLVLAAALVFSVAGAAEARSHAVAKHANKHDNSPSPRPLTRDGLPNIQAESAIIVDLDTGEELFAKNADTVRPIASVGKLFLALAVRGKTFPLDGVTEIHEEDRKFASGGARSRLPVGKSFTNHDLLRAMLISSDNRACTALGRGAGLGADDLIAAMNGVALKLGLTKTKFTDPSGLNGNVSTAREVVSGLKAALEDPVIAEILATPHAVVRSVGKKPVDVEYTSTDVALRTEKRFPVLGGKTGYTDEAKYCLAIAAKLEGRRVAMVFLGADGKMTRFGDFNRGIAWLQAGGDKQAMAKQPGGGGTPQAAP